METNRNTQQYSHMSHVSNIPSLAINGVLEKTLTSKLYLSVKVSQNQELSKLLPTKFGDIKNLKKTPLIYKEKLYRCIRRNQPQIKKVPL